MNDQPSQMAAIMASRICHDLVSPVGAIANGLELLEMSGVSGPEFDLIRDSVEGATARLKLFRIAFGTSSDDQMVDTATLVEVAGPAALGSKIAMTWRPDVNMPRSAAKRLCLGLMCLETALPYGGEVDVTPEGDALRLIARSDRRRDCADYWAWLKPDAERTELPPAALHFALLSGALAQAGLAAGLTETETVLSFRV